MIIFLWILFSVVVGAYANSKKTNGGFFAGLVISLILSPVVGLLMVVISKPNEHDLIKDGGMKKCPHCAELVKREALKCRFCGTKLEVPPIIKAVPVVNKAEEEKTGTQVLIFLGGIVVVILLLGWMMFR